ncbi:phosphate ABC transporter permease PstA [Streptomyces sp. 549]|uniref:phosphate ABC transporter permease PstA n=1 Tax=Streptomyces sp. 549 TaxID=3049076 RepID=UPI0024C4569E|nr:phosphate ABC transporter permease PstA [Streptomyces sp. 549]MDK1472247.1 phosphate ABC transporter permease PstA [Streptomyces sp. 549]
MSAPTLTKQSPPAPAGRRNLAGPRFRPAESLFRWMLLACLAIGMVFLAALLTYVIVEAWPRLDSRLWTNFPSVRRPENAGAQSAIMGTVWVISFTALFCLPTGIMAAIYLEEYADGERWYNRLIELNIQNLAAVPSIIYGILGLGLLARQFGLGTTVLTAALTLSLLVLPVVVIASREAIRAVPQSIRQASLALGATKWQTVSRQVLPAAVPGMATGSILALSRAIGEAAPVIMLGAVTFVMFNPEGLQSSYTVLPVQIFNWISESRQEFHHLAAAAILMLLAILLLMNTAAIWLRNRYSQRW